MFSLEFLIKKNVQKKSEKISSFEKINLFITGMRFSREYEIINKGEKTEIVLNFRKYLNGEEKSSLEIAQELLRYPIGRAFESLSRVIEE